MKESVHKLEIARYLSRMATDKLSHWDELTISQLRICLTWLNVAADCVENAIDEKKPKEPEKVKRGKIVKVMDSGPFARAIKIKMGK